MTALSSSEIYVARPIKRVRAKDEAQKKARTVLKGGGSIGDIIGITAPTEPAAKRYVIMDATYESLGVVLAENPNGVCAFRDELVSLLRTLDREEYAPARGFFLTAWNGTSGYTFDRIVRGRTHIDAACMSLRAVAFAEYLETHARRAYGAGTVAETAAAKAIMARLRKGDLPGPFSARDIYRQDWSNLSDREQVQAGLELLADLDWLIPETQRTGGRPRMLYHVNPRGMS